MKIQRLKFKHKKKSYDEKVGVPENLAEAVELLGEDLVYSNFVKGFWVETKRSLTGEPPPRPRKRYIRLDVTKLTPEQLSVLSEPLEAEPDQA